jgi:hypothetical protein
MKRIAYSERSVEMREQRETKLQSWSAVCGALVLVGVFALVACEPEPKPVPPERGGDVTTDDPFDPVKTDADAHSRHDDFPPEPTVVTDPALAEAVGGAVTPDRAEPRDLGGAERYLTRVSTDKPMYRPGETVYVRGAILGAAGNRPLAGNAQTNALVQIKGPKGDTVASGWVNSQESVLGFSWTVPEGQPGGEHVAKVTYPAHGHAPAERKFDVRSYRAPRLKTQIEFLRDGYGPGDRAGATLHVERAEGGFPSGARVTATARIDGREVFRGRTRVDAKGDCAVFFELPETIERGDGTLALTVEDGGVVETATKTIPILLQTVDLEIYPEGGALVAGLPARIYIEARTPFAKPADIVGAIVDEAGVEAAVFRTEHEGRGRATFTPRTGATYTLKITEPSGIGTTYPLPEVRDQGVVLRALEERTPSGAPVKLGVGVTEGRTVLVTLARREVEVASANLKVRPGGIAEVLLTPPVSAEGVLVATVWDEDGKPLAERLVYREPARGLRVTVERDRHAYVPGGEAKLTVRTTDERGNPVSAVVGLTVTDDSVLEMIEKREQAPRLPAMVFLEDDVRELADAHVYLDPANPEAPLALDLLLGTQGWRRFAFVDAPAFIAKHGDRAKRVLALRIVRRPRPRRSNGGWNRQGGGRFAVPMAAPQPVGGMPPDGDMAAAVAGPAKGRAENERDGKKDAARKPGRPRAAGEKRKKMLRALERVDKEEAREMIAADLADEEPMASRVRIRNDFVAVRVYAHKVRAGRRPGDRVDFAETLYWTAGVRTDANTGEAEVTFGLSDSVTTFRVFADAFSDSGALGAGTGGVESVEPFYVEPKLPLEVAAGDRILLPLGVVNATPSDVFGARVSVSLDGREVRTGGGTFDLGGGERVRRIVEIPVGTKLGERALVIDAKGGFYADRVTRKLVVKPVGFPVEVGRGGVTVPAGSVRYPIEIPTGVVQGSVKTSISVHPTPLASMTDSLKRLMREPHGCFEQTSSTTYPLVMAQQYFKSHAGVDPEIIRRSNELLEKGYKRLVGFECKKRGYEWFGADPGHEALSAYGLLEFSDMAEVREVDRKMIERTRAWLLGQRDGEGGFSRKRRALHRWIKDPDCSNAYIAWALLEAGEKGLGTEVAALEAAAAKSSNSYVLAVAANALGLAGRDGAASKLMSRLAGKQAKDGSVEGATTSVVGSGGRALKIETTSLAVLAWLKDNSFAGNAEKGMRFIADSCKGGRFGSTQSTVLALRAIVAYDKVRARPKAAGRVRLYVDGRPSGGWVDFDAETKGAIELPDIGEVLEPGTHEIELRMENGSEMPYSLAVEYHNRVPESSEECKLGLDVRFASARVNEGEVTEANVTVTNRSDESVPTPIAIIGIPGGLEPRHDQLKELVKAKRIAAYEVIGREVVLYWRGMEGGAKVEVPLSLLAAIPGDYTAPASRAYLYYTDEFKTWVEGARVKVAPVAKR